VLPAAGLDTPLRGYSTSMQGAPPRKPPPDGDAAGMLIE